MKKKILLGLLAIVMCFTLVGCGNNESTGGGNGGNASKFDGKYEYNPPVDNFYIETESSIYAKVGNMYTYREKESDEYNFHINNNYAKVFVYYEDEWVIDSNLSYDEYKDDYKSVYPLDAMDDYFMKYFRAYGFEDEKLNEYYVGNEKVAGVDCWVFDSKGLNAIYMKFWVDPSNGVTLKYTDYEDGNEDSFEVVKYDLNYKTMDKSLYPDSYEGLETW